MSEALDYFLDTERVCAEIDFPDSGTDYAFMLSETDWQVLLSKWGANSEAWRSAITYYAGFAFVKDSLAISLKGLSENNEETKLQALFSISESLNAEIDSISHKKKKKVQRPSLIHLAIFLNLI